MIWHDSENLFFFFFNGLLFSCFNQVYQPLFWLQFSMFHLHLEEHGGLLDEPLRQTLHLDVPEEVNLISFSVIHTQNEPKLYLAWTCKEQKVLMHNFFSQRKCFHEQGRYTYERWAPTQRGQLNYSWNNIWCTGLQPFGQLETFSSKVMLFTSEPQFQQLQKRNLKKLLCFQQDLNPWLQDPTCSWVLLPTWGTKPLIRSGENLGDIFCSHLINCNVFTWQPNFFHSGDQLMILAHHGALIYFFPQIWIGRLGLFKAKL